MQIPYTYSLKQGIEDGFLVPFRVDISTSNIDDYKYQEGDIVKSGEIDMEKVYSESDFYNGRIQIKERDEHRVQELLKKIDPDEKTIIFCATQKHAMIVRDMVNKHKKRPASNYCERVTADDGEVGEATLRTFQDNEKLLPTILTTSYKLSTGVDARNVRNIVLMRPVQLTRSIISPSMTMWGRAKCSKTPIGMEIPIVLFVVTGLALVRKRPFINYQRKNPALQVNPWFALFVAICPVRVKAPKRI